MKKDTSQSERVNKKDTSHNWDWVKKDTSLAFGNKVRSPCGGTCRIA